MVRYSSPGIDLRMPARQGPLAPAPDDTTAAFRALYACYLDPVYKYCYRRLPTVEDAEDATSQIFAKAFAALADQRGDHDLRAWLFTIAHNVVADHYRSRRPTLDLGHAEAIIDTSDSPEALAVGADALRSLLTRVPPDQAQILELRLAGLTGPEIAQVLGKSPGAIRVAQFRAYERLRLILGDAPPHTETRNALG